MMARELLPLVKSTPPRMPRLWSLWTKPHMLSHPTHRY